MKCRVNGCAVEHADHMLCCKQHWFQLPKAVRDQIWNLYCSSPGSDEHRELCFKALASLERRAS